ncbi:MAG: M23 family metallopeptidase [Acidimicrobiia bacterium]
MSFASTCRTAIGAVAVAGLIGTLSPVVHASEGESAPATTTTTTTPVPLEITPPVRQIVFPVVGPATYADSFGDCRDGCQRSHLGNDILTYGWKGVPVVAAHDGTVVSLRTDWPNSGCSVTLKGKDGWTTKYVHLNMDLPGTDVAGDQCFAPGIELGTKIAAGTLIGWIGDSGNAEHTPPHLHFEILDPHGFPLDPHASLDAAHHIDFHLADPSTLSEVVATAYDQDAQTAYVVTHEDLFGLGLRLGLLDAPLVPIDPEDSSAAHVALRTLNPERIVVFSDDADARFVDDLRALADIVEITPIADITQLDVVDAISIDEVTTESDSETDATSAAHPRTATPHTLTVVIGRSWAVRGAPDGEDAPLVIMQSENRPDRTAGLDAPSRPGEDSEKDGMWWLTADGWRRSDSVETAPSMTFALVNESDVKPWTLAFLASQASAPQVPIWFYQPTSRATKSL